MKRFALKNEEVAALQAKNEAARVATQRINEFRALYASKAVEYEELKVLLPEQREITNVLQGLQDNARDSRMTVMRFSPRDDTQQDVIMAKPVEIEVDSNFNNLRAFSTRWRNCRVSSRYRISRSISSTSRPGTKHFTHSSS